jgi:hypothetical protein
MESEDDAQFPKGTPKVDRGPQGGKVLRFDGPMTCSIDLKAMDVDPSEYDLITLQVKADRGAVMKVALENYPEAGDISYWWVLDSMRPAFGWRTIWVDLAVAEEIKRKGQSKRRWRKGLGEGKEKQQHLRISGRIKDLESDEQGPGRRLWLGDVRLVRKAVHLDWDQSKAPYSWGRGKPLVFTYPLTVTNRLDRPVTAELLLEPYDVHSSRAELDQSNVELAPKETKTVSAKVMLPAGVAEAKPALYCERYLAKARAVGVADSTVTILRSSDPIHLTVTVPIDESKMKLPLFPRPSTLPESVTKFDRQMAEKKAARDPDELIKIAMQHGLREYGKDRQDEIHYLQTFLAAAWLYDLTGDKKHLSKAAQLAEALPDIWEKWYSDYQSRPIRVISNGIVARWNEGHHYTLSLGWLVMGAQRSPYLYTGINAGAGSASALAYAFDIVAANLTLEKRQEIIDGFFLPAGIQARNHYIGDGNQQATANATAMYAGLTARNWPLVSFAYSSHHGYEAILEWCFGDDGVQLRKNYQTYTMRPLLWMSEMLYGCGVNAYERHRKRLSQIVHADTRAKGQGGPFQDMYFWEYVKHNRLAGSGD